NKKEKNKKKKKTQQDEVKKKTYSINKEGEKKKNAISRLQNKGIDLLETAPALFWNSLFTLNKQSMFNNFKTILLKENVENVDEILKHFTFVNKILANIALAAATHKKREYDLHINKLAKRLQTNIENTKLLWERFSEISRLEELSVSYNQK